MADLIAKVAVAVLLALLIVGLCILVGLALEASCKHHCWIVQDKRAWHLEVRAERHKGFKKRARVGSYGTADGAWVACKDWRKKMTKEDNIIEVLFGP